MRLLLISLVLCGAAHAQYSPGLTPGCPSNAFNTHKLAWMDRPEVTYQWCPGPSNTIDHWLTVGGAQADNEMASDILIARWEPRILVTGRKQTVMQADAKGKLTPYQVAGVPQTVSGNAPCRGPGTRLNGPFGSQVMYSAEGRFSDQHNLLPAVGLIWCYLTYPPTQGW